MNDLKSIVEDLLDSYQQHPDLTNMQAWRLPTRDCMNDLTHKLESLLYPGLIDCVRNRSDLNYEIGNKLSEVRMTLTDLVTCCLEYANHYPQNRMKLPQAAENPCAFANQIVDTFLRQLPAIRSLLLTDLHAAYHGDPAAKSYAEIILAYPGFRALTVYRLAHNLHTQGVPILPRMMSEYVHNRTGIDIHPGADIGPALFIDHGTGVVIGETTVIGSRVKIYQGVTLGALSIPDPDKNDCAKRHPTIEDDVTIYANSTILGGQTVVGARSVIGSNVWLTYSVPADTKVLFVQPDLRMRTV
ncbi:MAG: serine acetyltransferase [Proteobacteria bacterium]|nr:serine acetyltransferase [Pseudomonadota bacterium]